MPGWLMDVLIVLLAPVAALVGSHWGSRVAGREQLRYERRVDTVETVLTLLYELRWDFRLWIDPRGFIGRPADKLTEGELILSKLNRLRSYRKTRSMWLDPWVSSVVLKTLDDTIEQLGGWYGEYFDVMPKTDYGESEGSRHENTREDLARRLRDELPEAMERIEQGLIGSLSDASDFRSSQQPEPTVVGSLWRWLKGGR